MAEEKTKTRAWALAVFILGLGAAAWWRNHIDWTGYRDGRSLALFVGLYAVGTVLGIPGSLLTLGGAAVFGFWRGLLGVWVGANLGAAGAFLIARHLARDWVEEKLGRKMNLARMDLAIARSGWRLALLLRLAPVFPFNALNYFLGITGIRFRDYLIATLLGILPGTAAYVYVGSVVGEVARARGERTGVEWAALVFGLLATVAVSFYIVRMARQALAKDDLKQSDKGAAGHQPG